MPLNSLQQDSLRSVVATFLENIYERFKEEENLTYFAKTYDGLLKALSRDQNTWDECSKPFTSIKNPVSAIDNLRAVYMGDDSQIHLKHLNTNFTIEEVQAFIHTLIRPTQCLVEGIADIADMLSKEDLDAFVKELGKELDQISEPMKSAKSAEESPPSYASLYPQGRSVPQPTDSYTKTAQQQKQQPHQKVPGAL